eukprot:scaffold4049_cov204-Alexandrium_tamarense.AAC.48
MEWGGSRGYWFARGFGGTVHLSFLKDCWQSVSFTPSTETVSSIIIISRLIHIIILSSQLGRVHQVALEVLHSATYEGRRGVGRDIASFQVETFGGKLGVQRRHRRLGGVLLEDWHHCVLSWGLCIEDEEANSA